MPDTTTNGVPYMLGTDPADEIAVNLQALAEFLDPFVFGMQSGDESVAVGASTAIASIAVVFDRPYVTPPNVVVSQREGSPHFYGAWATAVTVNGFTLNAEKTGTSGSANIHAMWIAHGEAVS